MNLRPPWATEKAKEVGERRAAKTERKRREGGEKRR